MERRGVQVDMELNDDLRMIVAENSGRISESYQDNSFGKMFWQNQERAMAVHNAKSMQWDPLMIR